MFATLTGRSSFLTGMALSLVILGPAVGTPAALAQSLDQLADVDPVMLAPEATRHFYEQRGDGLIWEDDILFSQLLDALEGLRDHGLNPAHYHLEQLQALETNRPARDIYATDAWFSAASHMLNGKLDPVTIEPDWTARARESDLAGNLTEALAAGGIASSFEKLAPAQSQYRALVAEYRHLRSMADEPVSLIPAGSTLRAGLTGDRVESLQRRLIQLQLLEPGYQPGVMDVGTVDAVRLFQEMRDLEPDGLVGPATLAALNFGQRDKLEKLRTNMERWRWLPDDLGRRHVRVNIASFSVSTWEEGNRIRTHLAIVGRTYRKTPVFSDVIEYLIFNPWWEVPYSIARIDKLPLFRQEPHLVKELGFQVLDRNGQLLDADTIDWNSVAPGGFPFRLRQAPGENNALGQVKIMFPNQHNVYLHDTPTRGLFEHQQRAFSSGCIRTQFPLELSAWLLKENDGWNATRINEVVASGAETRVNLTSRVPIHVLYLTAVSEDNGMIRYLDDIYQRDERVLAGLRESHH